MAIIQAVVATAKAEAWYDTRPTIIYDDDFPPMIKAEYRVISKFILLQENDSPIPYVVVLKKAPYIVEVKDGQ